MTITFRLDDEATVRANLQKLAERDELPTGSLLLVLADADANATLAVAVDDVPPDLPQDERVRTLGPFMRKLREQVGVDGVVLVVARDGTPHVDDGDLAWHDAFAGTTRTARLACHGVYVVTPAGVSRVRPGARDAA